MNLETNKILSYAILIFLFLFLLATQKFLLDNNDMASKGFSDTKTYVLIAKCENNNNCAELGASQKSHHLERWLPHVLIGKISDYTGLDLNVTYIVANVLIVLAMSLLVGTLPISRNTAILILAFLLFTPYSFRSYFYAPPMIADSLFFLSIVMLVIALISKNTLLLFIAVFISVVSRQTSVILVPILLAAYYYGFLKIKMAFSAIGFLLLVFVLNQYISVQLFGIDPVGTFGKFVSLRGWNPDAITQKQVELFFTNLFISFALVAPLLLLERDNRNSGFVLIAVSCVIFQPLLGGPGVSGANLTRLVAYSYPFSIIFILDREQRTLNSVMFIVFFMAISMHHNYTIVDNKGVFISAILVVAFISTLYWFKKFTHIKKL